MQHIQAAQDLGVAAKEHRRINFFEGCPPPVRGAVRVARRRPREVLSPNPQGAQGIQQPLQTHTVQLHRLPAIGDVDFVVGRCPGNRSQRCHSEVMLVSGTGPSRAHRIVLPRFSA